VVSDRLWIEGPELPLKEKALELRRTVDAGTLVNNAAWPNIVSYEVEWLHMLVWMCSQTAGKRHRSTMDQRQKTPCSRFCGNVIFAIQTQIPAVCIHVLQSIYAFVIYMVLFSCFYLNIYCISRLSVHTIWRSLKRQPRGLWSLLKSCFEMCWLFSIIR